jgi:CRP-like cAMP-binding protein
MADFTPDSSEFLLSELVNSSLLERIGTTQHPLSNYFPTHSLDNPPPPVSVILPENSLKVAWDILTFVLILYQIFMFPYFIAFSTMHAKYYIIDLVSTAIFTADILLNFNVAFYHRGALVTDRTAIAKNYMKFWLWIDLISTFPYSWVVEGNSAFTGNSNFEAGSSSHNMYSSPALLRSLKLSRMLGLLKFAKLRKRFKELEFFLSDKFVSTLVTIARLVVTMVMLGHWIACFWVFISLGDLEHEATWLTSGGFADETYSEIYVSAIYWSLASMSSVGYGDIKAVNFVEKLVSILSIVIGSAFFTFIVSRISALIGKQTSDASLHRERVVRFNSFMKHHNIPAELKFKVRRYMEYVWEISQTRLLQENDFLELLSDPLRNEIYYHSRGKILADCKLFGSNFSEQTLTQLTRVLQPRIYAPNDIIFAQGEQSNEMHFIIHGITEVLHKRTQVVFSKLKPGSYFGEIGLFTLKPRKASIHCLEFVETLALQRESLETLADRFSELAGTLDSLQAECSDDNLSELGIVCFLCDVLGHVAVDVSCRRLIDRRIDLYGKHVEKRLVQLTVINTLSMQTLKKTRQTGPKCAFVSP